ncbi:hypothetical protein Hanom_Chr15g01413031 [Helianthus anomalus]
MFRFIIRHVLVLWIFSKNGQSFLCFWTPRQYQLSLFFQIQQDSNNIHVICQIY